MTFCVGIKVRNGLVALADTEIVKGGERLSKGKLSVLSHGDGFAWIMTSGLRSVRDKTMIYTENVIANAHQEYRRLYEIANLFGQQLRLVREEDGDSLRHANLAFNLHAIIGGRLDDDDECRMFYIYPEGNWIEVNADSPYFLIGRTYYARPLFDRLLRYETSTHHAAALAYLGFDATRASVTDVEFPIDMVVYDADSHQVKQHRFSFGELEHAAAWWEERLRQSLLEFPTNWLSPLLPSDGQEASSNRA